MCAPIEHATIASCLHSCRSHRREMHARRRARGKLRGLRSLRAPRPSCLPPLQPGLVREESTRRSQAAAVAAQRGLAEVMSGIPPNCGPAQRNTSSLRLDHLTPANDFHSQRRGKKKHNPEAHSETLND